MVDVAKVLRTMLKQLVHVVSGLPAGIAWMCFGNNVSYYHNILDMER